MTSYQKEILLGCPSIEVEDITEELFKLAESKLQLLKRPPKNPKSTCSIKTTLLKVCRAKLNSEIPELTSDSRKKSHFLKLNTKKRLFLNLKSCRKKILFGSSINF